MDRTKRKRAIRKIFTLIILIALCYWVFHDHYREIMASVRGISAFALLLLLFMGMGYMLLDALSYYVMVKASFQSFSFRQAVTLTHLGFFANISTAAIATIPLQSYYLYRQGITTGVGIASMLLESALHKLSVLLYALAALMLHHQWLADTLPELMKYLYLGVVFNALIIAVMLLLCGNRHIQQLAMVWIRKLPHTEVWEKRKASWSAQLTSLHRETNNLLHRRSCLYAMGINLLKLCWNFTIPYLAMRMLGIGALTFRQTQILSSMMFLLIGVLPGIAGIGPSELAFLMLFTPYIHQVPAASTLVLYRIADYFTPFILSVAVVLKVNHDGWIKTKETTI